MEKNPDSSDVNPFRYCAEYFDKETGTIYLRARYYDPGLGRFITEDSYWGESNDPLSLNLYTYCSSNPINFWDPTGHWQAGDANYSMSVQVLLLQLSVAWNLAETKEDKAAIHEEANRIREVANNGAGWWYDQTKSWTEAAADEFSFFLGGSISRAERDYWLQQVQKFDPNFKINDKTDGKTVRNASMFIAGILAPSPDDAIKMISKKAYKEMIETVGEKGAKKFFRAMAKFARKQGDNGIKELKGNGIRGFMWEVKIKGKGGAFRLLGNVSKDTGEIIWEVFEKTH